MPTDQIQVIEPPDASIGIPTGNLIVRVCRNAAAHLAGRNLISLGRLVVASTIARTFGKEIFGEYSLIIVMLAIAEWLLDFGTSDVFVREICRTPERGSTLLRILTGLKVVQTAVACAGFFFLIVALRYPVDMVHAALFAVFSLVFFGGVLIYHTLYKATLSIEREVAAELASVVVMICAVRAAAGYGHSVALIFACHMASRATFFVLCLLFGRARFHLSWQGVAKSDLRWGFQSSAAIGVIGLVVVVYESIDVLLLSRLGSLSDVAYYSGAQRFISPIVVGLTGVGSTLYPLAASYWPGARAEFERGCQRAMDAGFVFAGLAICAVVSGADFLMHLLGPQLAAGAPILRVLAMVLFVKAITNTLGPVLYVVQAQVRALWLVAGALVVKSTLIVALAHPFGYIGVAFSAVLTDSLTAACTLFLLRKSCGLSIRWWVPLKVVAATAAAAYVPGLLVSGHTLFAPAIAVALFVPLALLTGAVRMSEITSVMKWKAS